MEIASVLALLKALQPYIGVAMMGSKVAAEAVQWGADTIARAVAEGRGISQDEWNEWNRKVDAVHQAIQASSMQRLWDLWNALLAAFRGWREARDRQAREARRKLKREKKETRDELEGQTPSERKRTARRFVRSRPDRGGG